jgi:hypothetical protein
VYSDPDDMNILHTITSETPNYKQLIYQLSLRKVFIGFNIKGYDLRILNAIQNGCDPYRVYELSKNIVVYDDQTDIFNNYTYWNRFNFSDLYDDWRFGTLKEFESNIGMSIEECPVPFDKYNLTEEEKELIISYCKHDVKATKRLLEYRREYIDSKKVLSELFQIPLTTAYKSTNAKLAALILKAQPQKRPLETKFIIPEKVRPYLEENLPAKVLELFEEINEDSKEVYLFDNKITFGVGGIHSVYSDNIVTKTDAQSVLKNVDVTSYYPNLMMQFGYMSRNTANPGLFKDIYDLRVKLKKEASEEARLNGKTSKWKTLNDQQTALKLILNTTYGAMKNKYNALFDEYQASSLCYLGQLLLAALANRIFTKIESSIIIQTNTDGILVKVNREDEHKLDELVHEWEQITGMSMEMEYVKMFFQRDVNNYIEVTDNPKKPYKLKGKWTNQAEEQQGSIPNLNAPITHTALLEYHINNKPIEDTINECNDLFQFCFTCKTGRTFDKTYHFVDGKPINVNKVNRVVATTDRKYGTIKKYKKLEDGRERYDKIAEIPDNCKIVNKEIKMIDDLDRDWYINFTKNKIKELRWV